MAKRQVQARKIYFRTSSLPQSDLPEAEASGEKAKNPAPSDKSFAGIWEIYRNSSK